jgi:hypothetical protein
MQIQLTQVHRRQSNMLLLLAYQKCTKTRIASDMLHMLGT